jgi:hypothetical protein
MSAVFPHLSDGPTLTEGHARAKARHEALHAADLRAALDERSRAEFGLSLDDFVERLRAGELDADSVAVSDIAALVRLLQRGEAMPEWRRRLHRFFFG